MQAEPDLAEVEALWAEYAVPPERVILMPEGRTAEDLRKRSPWLAEICTQRGYRFSTRLHILIWGDNRGRLRGRDDGALHDRWISPFRAGALEPVAALVVLPNWC